MKAFAHRFVRRIALFVVSSCSLYRPVCIVLFAFFCTALNSSSRTYMPTQIFVSRVFIYVQPFDVFRKASFHVPEARVSFGFLTSGSAAKGNSISILDISSHTFRSGSLHVHKLFQLFIALLIAVYIFLAPVL